MPVANARTRTTATDGGQAGHLGLTSGGPDHGRSGRAGVDSEGPGQPGQYAAGPYGRQVHAEVHRVGLLERRTTRAAKRRTSRGRGLHGAQERHRDGCAYELAQLVQAGIRERQPGQGGIDRSNDLHAVAHEASRADQCGGTHDPDQGPRDPAVDLVANDNDDQDTDGDGQGPTVELVQLVEKGPHPADGRRAAARQAQDRR